MIDRPVEFGAHLGSFDEYVEFTSRHERELRTHREVEKQLLAKLATRKGESTFELAGWCDACAARSSFIVDALYGGHVDEDGMLQPNWRERAVCSTCGLNTRARATVMLIDEVLSAAPTGDVLLAEAVTPLAQALAPRISGLVSSEFCSPDLNPGATSGGGIRHEDLTNLSFDDESLAAVLHFDVLEHVDRWLLALAECARVLRPAGKLLFSAPFQRDSRHTIAKALRRNDDSVLHLSKPEYHGDPLDPERGILCFQVFGWSVLDDLRNVGFQEAHAVLLWDANRLLVGPEQLFIEATK